MSESRTRESRTSGLMSGIWKRKKRSDIQTPTNRKGRKQLRLNLTPPRQISTLPATLGGLNIDLDLLRAFSPPADKLGKSLGEFETYIRNNIEFIPNFGERYRQAKRSVPRLSNRRLIRLSASGSSKSSRCSGRRGVHTCCYKHGPKSLTTISRTSFAIGTRSFTLVPLDPRLLDALPFIGSGDVHEGSV